MTRNQRMAHKPNKKEEITDLFGDKIDKALEIYKKGQVLKFEMATIRITRVDKKNNRIWGEHIDLHKEAVINSHKDHQIGEPDENGVPFCEDCQTPVTKMATNEGHQLARLRSLQENEGTSH